MTGINAIQYPSTQPSMTAKQRQENQEKVAAGVGGAAGLTKSATNMASKRGLQAENALAKSSEIITETNNAVIKSSETATNLWTKFKLDKIRITNKITKWIETFKGSKLIAPIIKSSIVNKGAKLFGGTLAFFVLVTGVNKACKTGQLAINDFKKQYDEMRNF